MLDLENTKPCLPHVVVVLVVSSLWSTIHTPKFWGDSFGGWCYVDHGNSQWNASNTQYATKWMHNTTLFMTHIVGTFIVWITLPCMHGTVDLGELTHTRVPCGMSKLLPPMNQCTSWCAPTLYCSPQYATSRMRETF